MIKDYLARAMMVSMLEADQLKKVQLREKVWRHLIANWNIQELFGLPSIRERYGIPDEPEAQISHNQRIEFEIERLNLRNTEPYDERLDWFHMFDWNIFHSKGNIVWSYSGPKGRGNIKHLLE